MPGVSQYPPKFKEEVVNFAIQFSVTEASQKYGVPRTSISTWKNISERKICKTICNFCEFDKFSAKSFNITHSFLDIFQDRYMLYFYSNSNPRKRKFTIELKFY